MGKRYSKYVKNLSLLLFTAILAGAGLLAVVSYDHNPNAQISAEYVTAMTQSNGSSTDANLSKDSLVNLQLFIPNLVIDMRYASANNVFGKKIYEDANAYLRKGTADKLKAVQEELAPYGYTIKVWDAYRPPQAQYKLWEICPDTRYVANPYKGYSNHSRGASVDITLLDKAGKELQMPSKFDDFSTLADRNYGDVNKTAAENAKFLENIMVKHGFTTITTEWWHFDDAERKNYDIVQNPPPSMPPANTIYTFEDWRAGNYKPIWLNHDPQNRSLIETAINQGLLRAYSKGDLHYLLLNKKISRCEFAVMLARVMHLEINRSQSNTWYSPYTTALTTTGIIANNNWTPLDWEQNISRREMALWTGKALLSKGYQVNENMSFNGIDCPEIKASIAAGLILGDGKGNYDFDLGAERIHAAFILVKLQRLLNLSPLQYTDPDPQGTLVLPMDRAITISAIGDCTLGTDPKFSYAGSFNAIYKAVNYDYSYFFSNVHSVLGKDDLTIANLETTFTTAKNQADKGHQDAAYFFKGDPSFTQILNKGSIEAVNTANNHSYDYLRQGYTDTLSNLKKANILYFGNNEKAVAGIQDINVGMLGYNVLGRLEEGVNIAQLKNQIANDIQDMRNSCSLVIVSFHWGIEGSRNASVGQSELGRFSIDNGADLVLGHHPHVIQKIENYNGKYIVYSLGNFCFGGNKNPSDKDTFIYQQTFVFNYDNRCTDNSQVKVIPCSVSSVSNCNDYRPTIVEGDAAQRIHQRTGI
ncbi:MAG: CapA family protein [Methanobacterium sp.]